jgi:hypothetical protein
MTKSIKISNLEENVKDDFVKTAKELNITQKELFDDMWNTYKLFKIKFNVEEKEQFNNVIITFPDLFTKRIKNTIKKLNERLSWSSSNENETDIKYRNSSKSGFNRVKIFVDEMMKHNEDAKEWYDKKRINQKSIFDHAKERKLFESNLLAVGHSSIKQYISVNKIMIEEHNKKHGLSKDHNLKTHYFKMKENEV